MAAETHIPTRNGPWCGRDKGRNADIATPTDARDYSADDPTCPKCAKFLAAAQRASAAPASAPAAPPPAPKGKKAASPPAEDD